MTQIYLIIITVLAVLIVGLFICLIKKVNKYK